ncbi:ArsR family transcriptional regulator [Rhodobacter capsulatus]|uniref:ArsR family transcriptional regulator n=1 Tax=Rhodobacter capsulatus TaxID=1061 RepID=UPI004026F360
MGRFFDRAKQIAPNSPESDNRLVMALNMRHRGCSTGEIAAALGMSRGAVSRDLRAIVEADRAAAASGDAGAPCLSIAEAYPWA